MYRPVGHLSRIYRVYNWRNSQRIFTVIANVDFKNNHKVPFLYLMASSRTILALCALAVSSKQSFSKKIITPSNVNAVQNGNMYL